ncbi:hypothetical protein [Rubellimicrobium roseum]|uniref:Uncharacterized protein n=1 Tax=Rubellimicrobium roseum TaxID=687525 RepID=A0A5C4NJP6_9RHOB|nr:hypothetical protein [Rubellimicrobium roseum]TNC74342.1 hypothetical protein FHG71_03955 [Rubellimicrobium roseum]
MPDHDCRSSRTEAVAASQAINKTIRMILDLWQEVFEEELEIGGDQSARRRDQLLETLRSKFKDQQARAAVLERLGIKGEVDPEALIRILEKEFLGSSRPTSIDDFSPNQFLKVLREVCRNRVQSDDYRDIPLPDLLRAVLDRMFEEVRAPRAIRVGRNRHFPRLIQYLREYEKETTWEDGQGFRLMNASGRGSVSTNPDDPRKLKVRLNPDYL